MQNWTDSIKSFCDLYNIPVEHLSNVLLEPKVVPMIRGKAFEFTVLKALGQILPASEFSVEKEPINAQTSLHDVDVAVIHNPSGLQFSIECKLAAKSSYRFNQKTGTSRIRIKCMRSRTLGSKKVEQLAPKMGVSKALLSIHNDQYIPTDFDFVVTSLGNAFYVTDEKDGTFIWQPKPEEIDFLKIINTDDNNLKDATFNKLYIASSRNLSVASNNANRCTRRKCPVPDSCGFIPNYPEIHFTQNALAPNPPWYELKAAADLLRSMAAMMK